MAYEPRHAHLAEPLTGPGRTGFALVTYGFVLLIAVAVLYFAAAYVIPAIT